MDFQTPPLVCDYMVSLLGPDIISGSLLEPTPGMGHIVQSVSRNKPDLKITAPTNFWDLPLTSWFDYVIMNPPFSPMKEGFRYLAATMRMSNRIIALLPWFILINSKRRMHIIQKFGLVSVTHLPRETFPKTRIQCCIIDLKKGYQEKTTLHFFDKNANLSGKLF